MYISECLQICKIHASQWTHKGENRSKIHALWAVSLQLFDHLVDTKTAKGPSHMNSGRTFSVN